MISLSQNKRILSTITVLVFALPFLVMIHAHLVNGTLFILAAVAIYNILRQRLLLSELVIKDKNYFNIAIIVLFIFPIVAIFLGQLFRGEFSWPYYDSPSRFLLCLPVFALFYLARIDSVKYLIYAMPLALFFTMLLVYLGYTVENGDGRLSVYSVDLLTFGSLSLTFGLLCLVSIGVFSPFTSKLSFLNFFGFLSGIYLSVSSGSRTGWLALPVVIIFWIIYVFRKNYHTVFAVITLFFSLLLISYFTVQPIKQRIDKAAYDMKDYSWEGPNVDTSLGTRVSFYRIGMSLFMQRPFSGWGDKSFGNNIKDPNIYQFASQNIKEGLVKSGFHNELIASMVRSGIWGALSSFWIFTLPGVIFIKALLNKDDDVRKYGLWGLSYHVCLLVSAMSTEVFSLKYTASFHALILVFLMSATLLKFTDQKYNT